MRTIIRLSLSMAVIGVAATAAAQDATRFEVASIKPNRSGELVIQLDTEPGGRFITVNAPLRSLLKLAYDVEDFEIVGAPDWARSEGFDIIAIGRRDLPPLEGPGRGSPLLRTLLQALLRDRFSLLAHVETRSTTGFAQFSALFSNCWDLLVIAFMAHAPVVQDVGTDAGSINGTCVTV